MSLYRTPAKARFHLLFERAKEAGLEVPQIAELLGKHRSAIYRWLEDDPVSGREPDDDLLEKFENRLNALAGLPPVATNPAISSRYPEQQPEKESAELREKIEQLRVLEEKDPAAFKAVGTVLDQFSSKVQTVHRTLVKRGVAKVERDAQARRTKPKADDRPGKT